MTASLASMGVGSYYAWYYACYLASLLFVLVVLRVFRRRLPGRLRVAGAVIVGVLAVRLVLFDNPWVLRWYQGALTTESLGMRQAGVLDLEIRKYRRQVRQPPLANLAVGSSQVGAIFYHWASPPPEPVAVYTFAGMKALDYVLNEDAIAAYNPVRIILYLSAFDMTGSPELFSLPLAPPRPLAMWSIYRRLRAVGLTADETAQSLHAYLASQVLPEYRYSFVYRAMLRQWIGGAPRPAQAPSQRIPDVVSYFDPQWLDYNFAFLEEFLRFCQSRGFEVIVNEGQINPASRTLAIEALNRTVRSRIEALVVRFPNLRYIPAADVYEFKSAEYLDMTHVVPEAAKRYTARLSAYLTR